MQKANVEASGVMDDKRPPTLAERALADIQAEEDAATVKKLLTGRQEIDEREARYRQLVSKYGSNRKGRRRARAEANRKG